jgi:alanine racemase
MNRLGFPVKDMEKLAAKLKESAMKIQSMFSHMAASENPKQDDFSMQQFNALDHATREVEEKLGYSFLRHIANTAAIVRHPGLQMDMVRLGIGLYGIDTTGNRKLQLQAVATLKSTIAQIKHLRKGETVSYNRSGLILKAAVIATIRIGYADGYPRRLGNAAGKILINGKLAPVIGAVCMDMIMVDVSGLPAVKEGDEVIIFGSQLPIQQLAEWAETIPYEIMTGISQRVKRVFFEE